MTPNCSDRSLPCPLGPLRGVVRAAPARAFVHRLPAPRDPDQARPAPDRRHRVQARRPRGQDPRPRTRVRRRTGHQGPRHRRGQNPQAARARVPGPRQDLRRHPPEPRADARAQCRRAGRRARRLRRRSGRVRQGIQVRPCFSLASQSSADIPHADHSISLAPTPSSTSSHRRFRSTRAPSSTPAKRAPPPPRSTPTTRPSLTSRTLRASSFRSRPPRLTRSRRRSGPTTTA